MNVYLKQIVGLSLLRLLMDAALPEGESARFAALGMELAAMLCILKALFAVIPTI